MKAAIIFVAGCGRSGTSYLRTILSAHPDVFIPNESLFLTDYLRYARYVPKPLLHWLFFREPQLLCWYEKDHFAFEDVRTAITRIHETVAEDEGARIWGQKTPRFVRDLDLFDDSFPGIRWFLIYRDPRAVAASMKKSVQHTHSVVRACRRWKNDNRPILQLLRGETKRSNVMLLKYENLIRNYDATLEYLFRFVGLDPIDRDEVNRRGYPVFFKRSRFKINTVREDLNPNLRAIDSWRNTLTSEEVHYIEQTCADEMEVMGYESAGMAEGPIKRRFLAESLMDISILFQYLFKWPEFLIITALRKTVFHAYYIRNRKRDGLSANSNDAA